MSLVYLRELDQHTKFAIWRIEEDEQTLSEQLQLDTIEEQKLTSLSNGKRRLHWLATRVLLRTLLNTTAYIDCPSDTNGKPYLANFPQKISLTHSFDYAGAIISSSGQVGIDMELIKSKVERIAHKFLKEEELHFISKDKSRIEQLYACWSAKEAVYKLQGNAGVSFLHNMTIAPFEYEEEGLLKLYLTSEQYNRSFDVYYEKFNDYLLAYVVE
ncbi:4'-phosphopantetheinyl transferase [Sphingobacterium faecium NBRC 15299]|jgi:4'-phosphopantetheinyl transferase|uniref:4'-phosphopantetheinyl transferase family protein n=1 Tax=Sphingobacterium faecium TaxID=34087 RepID=UPI000D382DED|nr:4'-phosphopantetheinyl transferase superfamily protein [Sphingobacterium faecium]PTX12370.1 phosphopantetheine--protein transferase-like protein [Sphingobacterium faecium]GEM62078.1 4'-phosphopantetheinyl transferase [Sphingobacterium faecium NBRC 15299]